MTEVTVIEQPEQENQEVLEQAEVIEAAADIVEAEAEIVEEQLETAVQIAETEGAVQIAIAEIHAGVELARIEAYSNDQEELVWLRTQYQLATERASTLETELLTLQASLEPMETEPEIISETLTNMSVTEAETLSEIKTEAPEKSAEENQEVEVLPGVVKAIKKARLNFL